MGDVAPENPRPAGDYRRPGESDVANQTGVTNHEPNNPFCIGAAFVIAAFFVAPAQASNHCGPYEDMVKGFARNYGETPVWQGLSNDGKMVVVFAAESGTFTIVLVRPSGVACQVAAGTLSETLAPELLDPSALRISAQIESRPSCINGTFGSMARFMSSTFPRATMRVIRGAVAERFVEQLAAVPLTMRRDKLGVVIDWETKTNYVAIYSSENVSTRLMILVADPCVVLMTALDNSHVDKMLEKAIKRAGT